MMMNTSNYSLLLEDDDMELPEIPLIKQSDNARLLPKYSEILEKSGEDGVCMDDLDQLQLDLEKLCSNCTVRTRYLLSEIGETEKSEESDAAYDKTSLKRKRSEEFPKFRDSRISMKVGNKLELPSKIFEDPQKGEPYIDSSDKFWSSIQPFCSSSSDNDLMDGLMDDFSTEIEVKMPEIGEQYTNGWAAENSSEEKIVARPAKRVALFSDVNKTGYNPIVETFATPLIQRLLAGLIEEKVMKTNGENGAKTPAKSLEFTKIKSALGGQKIGPNSERKLRKELIEQGIIDMDDFSKF